MATTTRHLTYDDLEAIPQEREGDRHELIDGELIVTPSPIPVHHGPCTSMISARPSTTRSVVSSSARW